MSVFPLNIETKEDHPDKVAKLQGVATKYYLTDAEINVIYSALTELYDSQEQAAAVFTATQITRLKALVYEIATQSLTVNVSSFEKGVATNLIFTWNVLINDDTLVSATLDGNDVTADANGSNDTLSIANVTRTKSITLVTVVTSDGSNSTITNTRTSTERVPQYMGKMTTDEPPTSYAGLAAFTKLVQSSTDLTQEITLNNEHLFFLVNSSSKQVFDNDTNFAVSMGAWNSTTAEFISKSLTTVLADGTNQTLTLIRTREKKTQTLNVRLQ